MTGVQTCALPISLSNLGRYQQATAAYDATLAIQPDDYQALYRKGLALHALGRDQEAQVLCNAALAINPDLHQGR